MTSSTSKYSATSSEMISKVKQWGVKEKLPSLRSFHSKFWTLIRDESPTDDKVGVVHFSPTERVWITDELARKMLCKDSLGQTVKENTKGIHPVASKGGIHFKPDRHPELCPGREMAASLFLQLVGQGREIVAPATAIKVSVGKEEPRLVQASLTIGDDSKERLSVIDLEDFITTLSLFHEILKYVPHVPTLEQYWQEWNSSRNLSNAELIEELRTVFSGVYQPKDLQNLDKEVGYDPSSWIRTLSIIKRVPQLIQDRTLLELVSFSKLLSLIDKLTPNKPMLSRIAIIKSLEGLIDFESYAALTLGSIFLMNTDGKPDNYLVKIIWKDDKIERLVIIAIDNDTTFGHARSMDNANQIGHRCVLYTFPHLMKKPIPASLRKQFENPQKFFTMWISLFDACNVFGYPLVLIPNFFKDMISKMETLNSLKNGASLNDFFCLADPLSHLAYKILQERNYSTPVEMMRAIYEKVNLSEVLASHLDRTLVSFNGTTRTVREVLSSPQLQLTSTFELEVANALSSVASGMGRHLHSSMKPVKQASSTQPFHDSRPSRLEGILFRVQTNQLLKDAIQSGDPGEVRRRLEASDDKNEALQYLVEFPSSASTDVLDAVFRVCDPNIKDKGVPYLYQVLEKVPDEFLPRFIDQLAKHHTHFHFVHADYGTPLDYAVRLEKPKAFTALCAHGCGLFSHAKQVMRYASAENLDYSQLCRTLPKAGWRDLLFRAVCSKKGQEVQGVLSGLTHIRDEIWEQIPFDSEKRISSEGKVLSTSKGKVVFSGDMSSFGSEQRARFFFEAMIDHGMPQGDVFRFIDSLTSPFPVKVSQQFEGLTLEQALATCDSSLQKLNLYRLHNLILCTMLLNPRKREANQYRISPFDLSSFELVAMGSHDSYSDFSHHSNENCALFHLDQMHQPVDVHTRDLFLSHEPLEVLRDWLIKIIRYQRRYSTLFTPTSDFVSVAQETLEVPFQPGFITVCYQKLRRMQDLLRQYPQITPAQILEDSTSRLTNHQLMFHQQACLYTPSETLKELKAAKHSQEQIYRAREKVLRGSSQLLKKLSVPDLKELTINGIDFQAFSREEWETVFHCIVGAKIAFNRLILRHAPVLDHELEAIIKQSPSLTVLNIEGCRGLTLKSLPVIHSRPSLQELVLPTWHRDLTIALPALTSLSISGGNQMTILDCMSPLQQLVVGQAPALTRLYLTTCALKALTLGVDCKIPPSVLTHIGRSNPHLMSVQYPHTRFIQDPELRSYVSRFNRLFFLVTAGKIGSLEMEFLRTFSQLNPGYMDDLGDLSLSGVNISENNAEIFALVLAYYPRLKTLNLSKTGLTCAAALPILRRLGEMKELKTLDISDNTIQGFDIQSVADAIAKLSTLDALNFSTNGLEGISSQLLVQSLVKLKALRHLDLRGNSLDTLTMTHLTTSFNHLTSVKFDHV